MATVTQRLAGFAQGLTLETLPPDVVARARACLLNGYGIALGCLGTPYAPVATQVALALEGKQGGATLLSDGRHAGVAGAALANAALFHGRAQEDTCGAAHLGAVMIPLLTALIEARGLDCRRLLPALVAGYEVGGLLERAYGATTTPVGLRATTLYGAIAAATAAGHLLALPAPALAAAMANAVSFSGGLLQSFADGTDEWRYQVGTTAVQGLFAAELARAGSVSAPHAIEGRAGFARVFARKDCDGEALLAGLGRDWSIHRVTFKPYPVCAFNQTPVTAALALAAEIGGRPLQRVEVEMNPFECGYAGMDAKGPFHSISGTLMSIPFCIAATLLRGAPTMQVMTTYDDAAVNALEARTELRANPEIAVLSCRITAVLADGTKLVRHEVKSTADYAYDWAGVSALVRRVGGEIGVPPATYDRLEGFVESLPSGRIDEIARCFAEARDRIRITAGREGAAHVVHQ